MEKPIEYFVDDRVIITEKNHAHYEKIGRVKKVNYKKMEYMVELEDSIKKFTLVTENEIEKYFEEKDLKDLIELTLMLGEPAKEMFYYWAGLLNKIKR